MKRNRLFVLASSALVCAAALFSCGESKLYSCWGKTYSYQDGYTSPWMENSPYNPDDWNNFLDAFANKNVDFSSVYVSSDLKVEKFAGSTIDEFKTYCATKIIAPTFKTLKEYKFEFKAEGDKKQMIAKKGTTETIFDCTGETNANPDGTIKQYSLTNKGETIGTIVDGYFEDSNIKGITFNVMNADNVLGINTSISVSFNKKNGGEALNPLSFSSFLNEAKA